MRLIDADDALKWAREYMRSEERGLIEEFFRDCPTISPDSLRERGRWIKHEGYTECSQCEYWYDSPEIEDAGDRSNYCPSCGARMGLEG